MSAETNTRPFQVGDRVRITDHLRHNQHPDAQYVYEGVVEKIDPAADPDSEHEYGPYLWAETEAYTSPLSGETFDRVFCPMADDLTTGSDGDDILGRTIELLEPARDSSDDSAPEPFDLDDFVDAVSGALAAEVLADDEATQDHGPLAAHLSDRTLDKVLSRPAHVPRETPSLVEMDRQEARARVLDAAFVYEDAARGRDVTAEIEARDAFFARVRECRKAVTS